MTILADGPPQTGAWADLSHVPLSDVQDSSVSYETIEGLPTRLVEAYAAAASRHARVREVDPGVWVASVVGLEGAWADGETAEEALEALPEAIVGWVAVKLRLGAADIPRIEGLNVNRPGSE